MVRRCSVGLLYTPPLQYAPLKGIFTIPLLVNPSFFKSHYEANKLFFGLSGYFSAPKSFMRTPATNHSRPRDHGMMNGQMGIPETQMSQKWVICRSDPGKSGMRAYHHHGTIVRSVHTVRSLLVEFNAELPSVLILAQSVTLYDPSAKSVQLT